MDHVKFVNTWLRSDLTADVLIAEILSASQLFSIVLYSVAKGSNEKKVTPDSVFYT